MSERVFVSHATQKPSFFCCYGDRALRGNETGRSPRKEIVFESNNGAADDRLSPIGGSMNVAGAVAELNKEIEHLTLIRDSLLQAPSSVQARGVSAIPAKKAVSAKKSFAAKRSALVGGCKEEDHRRTEGAMGSRKEVDSGEVMCER
jgi:hypothetical protein